jgi:hypothetical protein
MKDKILKKEIGLAIALILVGTIFVPSIYGEVNLSDIPLNIYVKQSGDIIEINYQLNSFSQEKVIIDDVEYSIFYIGEESNLLIEGQPDIPTICRSIVIPDTAKMEISVVSSSYEVYENVLIAPSKGNLLRTINPDDIPYLFGEVYYNNGWFPQDIASLREPYIIRDFRGQVVEIFPIQYNPVTKQMRFYTNINVEIYADGIDTINIINRETLPEKVDFEFNQIYNHHFLNFKKQGRYDPVLDQGNMLVIVYDSFWDEMIPFVNWKNIKGILTEMVKVSDIGNAESIKTYIANYYNSNGLTYVLLVGDDAQVPTYYPTYHASDPTYSYIVGNDHYPDLFVGRFSAETVDQLQTQIERTLEYEQLPQTGADWYKKGLGVASNQGPGDDGEYDDEHMDNIRDKLLAYTYIQVDQSYDYTGTTAYIAASLNEGRSITNYCGHGSPTSWGNGGGFSNSDVDALTNDNMLPFITSVACNNGEFDGYTCFAEAWMRATNNGEPTGSIANFMSSKSQGWNPPMDAQDEFVDLIIETYPDLHITAFGAAAFNGCMHMNDEYGASGYAETDAWHVFGDPSVQVRTDTPSEMDARHDSNIDVINWTLEVEVIGVEGALCALSKDNEFLGSAYTDENGFVTIEIEDPQGTDPLDLVVTAYNKIPYITQVLINSQPAIPDKPDGPNSVKVDEEAEYSTTSTDLDDDEIWYMWRWGDGYTSDWIGPYSSGETATSSHIWSESSIFQVRVKAKDSFEQETDWSEILLVHVEKSKSINRPVINFLNNHPNLFPILHLLIQLLNL